MKQILIVLTLCHLLLSGCRDPENNFTIDCLPQELQNDVIAFYAFNNGSLEDISGNNNDFNNTTNASSASDRLGNSFCAFEFNNAQGPTEFLKTTATTFLNGLDNFTISAWYIPKDNTIDGSNLAGIFSRGTETSCPDRMGDWSLGLYDCRRAVFAHNNAVWANAVTNLNNDCQGEIDALVDNWQHVVGVKNGNDYRIYFNGLLNTSVNGNAACTNLVEVQDIGDAFIGYNFTGVIDDIIIYDKALNENEISLLYEVEPCCE